MLIVLIIVIIIVIAVFCFDYLSPVVWLCPCFIFVSISDLLYAGAALDFPTTYEAVLRKIHRLLFHVVAHLYHQHFRELLLLGNNPPTRQFNSSQPDKQANKQTNKQINK